MNGTLSDRLFSGLDAQQSAVVRHLEGPALVVAGAGAGKTTTLVRRTANLISKGVDPSRILLLTFTRAAARSIMDRARSFTPEADRVQGGTFHSIASRVIRENNAMFDLPQNFTVCDPGDVEDTIKRLCAEVGMKPNAPRASTVGKVLSFGINTGRPVEDVVRNRYYKYLPHVEEIEEVGKAYVRYKKKHNLLDFDDLLSYLALMAEHEIAGPMLRRRFGHVMIDEVQDLNELQLRIARGLGAGGGNVMAVGDPSQSIYAFRGSAPSVMFSLRDVWPTMRTYLIETNYRSTPEIVACADTVDRSMRRRFDRILVANKGSEGIRPRLVNVEDHPSEAAFVADMIMDKRDEGVGYGEQAVLVRSMRQLRHVEVELAARNIPTVVRGGIRIHDAKHVKDVLAPLRIVANLDDDPAWVRLLTCLPRVGEKTAVKLVPQLTATRSVADAAVFLRELAATRPNFGPAPDILEAAMCSTRPAQALSEIRAAMDRVMLARYEDEWDWRKKDVDAIVDVAAGYEDIVEFLRTLTIDVSVDKGMERFDYDMEDDEGVVTLSTVHSAKGLEWKVVYVPSFAEGHMPSLQASLSDDPEDMDEERRLFYVAVTRAKSELMLVKPRLGMVKGALATMRPTPFEYLVRSHLFENNPGPATPRPDYGLGSLAGLIRPR